MLLPSTVLTSSTLAVLPACLAKETLSQKAQLLYRSLYFTAQGRTLINFIFIINKEVAARDKLIVINTL